MSPELKLVILYSTPKKNLALPQEQLDYKKLLTLSIRHRTFPSLYYCLKNSAHTKIAPEFLEKLCAMQKRSQKKMLALTNELKQLDIVFKEHHIQFSPFKGPLLGKMLYGDVALRPARDLDLWIDLKDIKPAAQLLFARGYRSYFPAINTPKKLKYCARNNHHLAFINDQTKIIIELHTSKNELFDETDKEALLLYLCRHGSAHHWYRLRWLADIVLLINLHKNNWDWKNLFLRAQKEKTEYAFALGLILANHYYQLNLPILISNNKIKNLIDCCIKEIDNDDSNNDAPAGNLKTRIYFSKLSKPPVIMNLTDVFEIIDLSDRYFFCYYFLAPIPLYRLMIKLMRGACGLHFNSTRFG